MSILNKPAMAAPGQEPRQWACWDAINNRWLVEETDAPVEGSEPQIEPTPPYFWLGAAAEAL